MHGVNQMFFMMGINDERKDFDFSQLVICDACGAYGRYSVFMTCMVLSIFCIPLFRWNRRYFVQTSCCKRLYELDGETGRRIARGEQVEISKDQLKEVYAGGYSARRCANCGYATSEDFEFCPKCGRRF